MSSPPDVFSPAKLGPIALRNRIIKAATFEARTPDALVTDDLIEYHRLPAAGGVGMTTVAYCAVSPGGRTEGNGLWMRPEAVPGLRRLTETIHAEGAAVSAQIGHAGPVANAKSNKATALAPVRFFNPIGMRFAKKAGIFDRATLKQLEQMVAGEPAGLSRKQYDNLREAGVTPLVVAGNGPTDPFEAYAADAWKAPVDVEQRLEDRSPPEIGERATALVGGAIALHVALRVVGRNRLRKP